MRGEHIAGPYWVRTVTNGKHQVCGRNGATICEYRADQIAMADAHCRKLQARFTKAEKALRDAAPDLLAALQALVAPHYDEDGVIDPSTAISIVGENRRGEKQLKGSFMEALERARAAIARATGAK